MIAFDIERVGVKFRNRRRAFSAKKNILTYFPPTMLFVAFHWIHSNQLVVWIGVEINLINLAAR